MRTRLIPLLLAAVLCGGDASAAQMLRYTVNAPAEAPAGVSEKDARETVLKGADEGFYSLLKVFTESRDQCRAMIRKERSDRPDLAVDIQSLRVSAGTVAFSLRFRLRTPWGAYADRSRDFSYPRSLTRAGNLRNETAGSIYDDIRRFVLETAVAEQTTLFALTTPPPGQAEACRAMLARRLNESIHPSPDLP